MFYTVTNHSTCLFIDFFKWHTVVSAAPIPRLCSLNVRLFNRFWEVALYTNRLTVN